MGWKNNAWTRKMRRKKHQRCRTQMARRAERTLCPRRNLEKVFKAVGEAMSSHIWDRLSEKRLESLLGVHVPGARISNMIHDSILVELPEEP